MAKQKTEYMTFVFEVKDRASFQPMLDSLGGRYALCEFDDWAVTAMSKGDEIKKLELIEEAAAEGRLDLIKTLLSIGPVDGIESIHDIAWY